MPRSQNLTTAKKSVYAWTTGKKRSITHLEPIGKGGFGEVHKVCMMADQSLNDSR